MRHSFCSEGNGFTLVETMIAVAIIGILTLIITAAYPDVRDRQALVQAEQLIQSRLRDAEQAAFNEERTDECLAQVGDDSEQQKRCSDIGINIGVEKIRIFADLNGDGRLSSGDFLIDNRTHLPDLVTADLTQTNESYVFRGDPPTLELVMYDKQDGEITPPGTIVLMSGGDEVQLSVGPYGQISRVADNE